MAFDREGAKAAGYTDAEIEAYIAANPEVASAPPATGAEPPPPEKIYTEPGSEDMVTPSAMAMAGAAVAPYAIPAAIGVGGVGGAYGLYKFGSKALDVGREVGSQMNKSNEIAAAREARMANRPGFGGVPKSGPVAPAAIPEPLPAEVGQVRPGAEGRPGTTRLPSGTMAPVQPTAMPQQPKIGGPAAAEGANFIENISKKYLPAAGRAFSAAMDTPVGRAVGTGARVLGSAPVMGAQLALTPSSTGPAVPSVGRLRGSEINPMTRRPWTAQELVMYEKNPAVFDQQLPAPQMPR